MATSVMELFSGEAGQRIGWALIHFLWQGTVVALLLAGLLHVLRRRSAQARWLASCVALGLMALLPVMTALVVPVNPAEKAAPALAAEVATLPATAESEVAMVPAAPLAPTVAEPPTPTPVPALDTLVVTVWARGVPWYEQAATWIHPALPWLLAAWLMGVLAISLWHVGGWLHIERAKRRGTRAIEGAVRNLFQRLLARLRVSRPVRLLESARVAVPVVVGWLRPVVLLPASMLTGLTPAQLEAILAHELAHIRRYDCLVRLLQAVVETLLFYHPAVWWVSRRITEESELCCDELAVAVCGNRRSYAAALARVAELGRGRPQLAVAASGGRLVNRIRRVLTSSESDHGLRPGWLAGMLAIAALITGLAIILGCMHSGGPGTTGLGAVKGQIIDQPGKYVSPGGRSLVEITRLPGDELTYLFTTQGKDGPSTERFTKPFGVSSGWFMCWDKRDRLWAYVPEHGGCHVLYGGPDEDVTLAPGERGGWDGIPEAFLARLPEALQATCRNATGGQGGIAWGQPVEGRRLAMPADGRAALDLQTGKLTDVDATALGREHLSKGELAWKDGALLTLGGAYVLQWKDEWRFYVRLEPTESLPAADLFRLQHYPARLMLVARGQVYELLVFAPADGQVPVEFRLASVPFEPGQGLLKSLLGAYRHVRNLKRDNILIFREGDSYAVREGGDGFAVPLKETSQGIIARDSNNEGRWEPDPATGGLWAYSTRTTEVMEARLYIKDTVVASGHFHLPLAMRKVADEADTAPVAATADAAWGEAGEGVQVRLRAEKREWKAGEVLVVTADARNGGGLKLRGSPLWDYEVEIDGQWFRRQVLVASPESLDFGPGKELLDTKIALNPQESGHELAKKWQELAPGQHTVRVAFSAEGKNNVRAVSNAVEIEVLPAEAKPAELGAMPALPFERLTVRITSTWPWNRTIVVNRDASYVFTLDEWRQVPGEKTLKQSEKPYVARGRMTAEQLEVLNGRLGATGWLERPAKVEKGLRDGIRYDLALVLDGQGRKAACYGVQDSDYAALVEFLERINLQEWLLYQLRPDAGYRSRPAADINRQLDGLLADRFAPFERSPVLGYLPFVPALKAYQLQAEGPEREDAARALEKIAKLPESRRAARDERLGPQNLKEIDRLLAEAHRRIRQGLVDLASAYPQLATANNRPLQEALPAEAGTGGALGIWVGRNRKAGRTPWKAEEIPEGWGWNLMVHLFPVGGRHEMSSIAFFPTYRNLGLDGNKGAGAADPALDAALKKLLEEALAPLKALDEQIGQGEPAAPPIRGGTERNKPPPDRQRLEQLWRDLGSHDFKVAYEAVGALADSGDAAAAFLRQQIEPVLARADPAGIRQLVAELDHDQAKVRDRAWQSLETCGRYAAPYLRTALRGAKSDALRLRLGKLIIDAESYVPQTEGQRRMIRAVRALELIGTEQAQVLVQAIEDSAVAPGVKAFKAGDYMVEAGFLPDQAEYVWGEPIQFFTFVATNVGEGPLAFTEGGDYGGGRSESHKISAVDAGGKPVPSPQMGGEGGGLLSSVTLKPGETYLKMLPADRRLIFGGPGVYAVGGSRTLALHAPPEDGRAAAELTVRTRFRLTIHPFSKARVQEAIDNLEQAAASLWAAGVSEAKKPDFTEPREQTPANRLHWILTALEQLKELQVADRRIDASKVGAADARAAAVRSLGELQNRMALDAVVAALGHEDAAIRRAAAGALGDDVALVDPQAVMAALTRAVADDDEGVRVAAADALGKAPGKADYALPEINLLRPMMNDKSELVRNHAVAALRALGEPFDPTQHIARIRAQEGGNDWQNLIWLVRKRGGKWAAPALVRCLEVDKPSARNYYNYTLVWQIGACGGPNLKYHHDFDQEGTPGQVKQNADVLGTLKAWADEWYKNNPGKPALESAAAAGDAKVDEAQTVPYDPTGTAPRSTARGRQALENLLKGLADDDAAMRAKAARAIGELGEKTAFEPLLAALKDKAPAVRCNAAEAIGLLGDQRGVELLKGFITGDDLSLRVAAARGLVALKQPLDPEWLVPVVRTRFDSDDFHEALRLIRLYGKQRAAAALVGCLNFDDPRVSNSRNMYLLLAIEASPNGPKYYSKYHSDPGLDGTPDGTPEHIEENRKMLAELKAWLADFQQREQDAQPAALVSRDAMAAADAKLPFWFDILPLSPAKSIDEFLLSYRLQSLAPGKLEIATVDLEIRTADNQKRIADLRNIDQVREHLGNLGRFPGGTFGALELAQPQRRLIGSLPDGDYLVALTYWNRLRCSNVAPLRINSKYDPKTEPILKLVPLPLAPGQKLPSVGLVATGPDPVDPQFTNMEATFPKLVVDNIERRLTSMGWVGFIGPLQSGQRRLVLLDLTRYAPDIQPKAEHTVKARVLNYESAEVTIPAKDDLGLAWDKATAALPALPPPVPLVRGTVTGPDGKPAAGYEVNLSAAGSTVTERCDERGRYEFVSVSPGECSLGTHPPAMGQPALLIEKVALEAGKTLAQDLSFAARFTLAGTVTWQDGTPAAGKEVSVTAGSDDGRTQYQNFTKTDAAGRYTMGLPFDAVSYVGLSGTGEDGPLPRKNNVKASAGPVDLVIQQKPPGDAKPAVAPTLDNKRNAP